MKPNMTPFLPHHHPSISLQPSDDLVIRKAWDFRHIDISIISAFGVKI
jgi:hypothetical protein